MFDILDSLGTIIEDSLTVPVERVDGELGDDDRLEVSFAIAKEVFPSMSKAKFMSFFVVPCLVQLTDYCNNHSRIQVAAPQNNEIPGLRVFFFDGIIPIRYTIGNIEIKGELIGKTYFLDTLMKVIK